MKWKQPSMEDELQRKKMSSKYKGISQQPLVGSYSNGRQPPSDLKLCKVEYFINQWSVLTQIWNWSRVYKGMNWRQPLIEWISKYEKKNIWATTGRILFKLENKAMGIKTECTKVSNEDNLKIKKMEYLSNHW